MSKLLKWLVGFGGDRPALIEPLTIEPGTAMLIAGGISAGSGLLGGLMGGGGSEDIAEAMRAAVAEQRRQYDETVGRMSPFYEFGRGQLNELGGWLADPNKQPSSYLDPAYAFRQEQGLAGLYGNAATAGLLQSGDTLRSAQRYGQRLASEEYGNAFNRWLAEGGFRQGLAGMGQSAAANLGYLGSQTAANIGNLMGRAGEAEAEGRRIMGGTIAGVGGLSGNTLARYLMMQGQPDGGGLSGSEAYAFDNPWFTPDWNNPAMWGGGGGMPGGSDIFYEEY